MNQRLTATIAILMSAALWACSAPAEYAAQQNLDESRAQYAQCVATHGTTGPDCDSAKENYQSSQQDYDQTESQTPTGLQVSPPGPDEPGDSGAMP